MFQSLCFWPGGIAMASPAFTSRNSSSIRMRPEPCVLMVKINKPHFVQEMYEGRNCALRTTDAAYPRPLTLEHIDGGGALVVEPDNRVRLGVLPGQATKIELLSKARNGQDINLLVTFPARQYSVNGERRSFALLRPVSDAAAQEAIRALILEAYAAVEAPA